MTNVGNRDTRQGFWYDRVYLSQSPSLDDQSYMLGQVAHYSILPTGQSYTASIERPAPRRHPGQLLHPGLHRLERDRQPDDPGYRPGRLRPGTGPRRRVPGRGEQHHGGPPDGDPDGPAGPPGLVGDRGRARPEPAGTRADRAGLHGHLHGHQRRRRRHARRGSRPGKIGSSSRATRSSTAATCTSGRCSTPADSRPGRAIRKPSHLPGAAQPVGPLVRHRDHRPADRQQAARRRLRGVRRDQQHDGHGDPADLRHPPAVGPRRPDGHGPRHRPSRATRRRSSGRSRTSVPMPRTDPGPTRSTSRPTPPGTSATP